MRNKQHARLWICGNRFSCNDVVCMVATDYCRAVLRDGRGVAFVCRPSCGELLPFQECIVDVVAYSDMWGEYKDHLLCKVSLFVLIHMMIEDGEEKGL